MGRASRRKWARRRNLVSVPIPMIELKRGWYWWYYRQRENLVVRMPDGLGIHEIEANKAELSQTLTRYWEG